eukprot:COSAG01_NODE_4842_length_4691_cov_4.785061_1_plen_59_part_00
MRCRPRRARIGHPSSSRAARADDMCNLLLLLATVASYNCTVAAYTLGWRCILQYPVQP